MIDTFCIYIYLFNGVGVNLKLLSNAMWQAQTMFLKLVDEQNLYLVYCETNL